MALVDVIMPQMGESIAEGTITKWFKKVGEKIGKDETLLEISTDKVDSEIPAPVGGVIAELLFPEQKTVAVHTVIARIATEGMPVASNPSVVTPTQEVPAPVAAPPREVAPSAHIAPSAEPVAEGRFYSPLVLNIARTEHVSVAELERIPGTGAGGRVSKNDILAYVQGRKGSESTLAALKSPPSTMAKPAGMPVPGQVIKMDTMRKAIADHMVRSVHTSAHVSSVTEADVSRIVAYRERHRRAFEEREGFKLTYTPFVVEAVTKALKDYPMLNASVDGDTILIRKEINIGVAVALESGLIVPVVKNADAKNIVGLARAVNDLSTRARTKKLTPDEVQGGTFTITNPGIFGNLFGTPIINQPQVAILGMGAIKKRPVVIDDAIAIRSMVYISMSYDHRIIDGALGGMYLQRVVEYLENFDQNQAL